MKPLIDNNPYITLLFDTFLDCKAAIDKMRAEPEPNEANIKRYITQMDCIKGLLFDCEYHVDYDHKTNTHSLHKVNDPYAVIHDYDVVHAAMLYTKDIIRKLYAELDINCDTGDLSFDELETLDTTAERLRDCAGILEKYELRKEKEQ